MRSIAIWNQKGGSGKTTTAVNLAAALAERGRRVLLLDLDAQHNASTWMGVTDAGKELLEVLRGERELVEVIRETKTAGVEIVASSAWLVGAERLLTSELDGEYVLAEALKALPADRWHYVLYDCPPSIGMLTSNALIAARELLVPVEAHHLALEGLAELLKRVEWFRDKRNPDLRITGVLICRQDGRTRHGREVADVIREKFGPVAYATAIRENVRLAESPSFGEPILAYDSRSNGAADYRALALEVIAQETAEKGASHDAA